MVTGKHLGWSLFLIKLQAWRPGVLFKKDSNTGVFLWILGNSWEHIFWSTAVNDCFYTLREFCNLFFNRHIVHHENKGWRKEWVGFERVCFRTLRFTWLCKNNRCNIVHWYYLDFLKKKLSSRDFSPRLVYRNPRILNFGYFSTSFHSGLESIPGYKTMDN